MCRAVKLRGNSTGHASRLHRARRVCRAVKLRGNSTGYASRLQRARVHVCEASTCVAGVSRRQAKEELHRARVQAPQGTPPGVARVCRAVKLRGNSTRHVSRCRLRKRPQSVRKASACVARVCRAVKLRGNSTGHASRLHRHASRLHRPRPQV